MPWSSGRRQRRDLHRRLNYDGTARVEELMTGINIALGSGELAACVGFDLSRDGKVTIDELLGGVHNALQGCPRARFEPELCDPALLPAGQDPANMRCGSLIVPENRSRQNGHTIRLATALLHATGASAAPDPLVLLTGGPGDWALDGLLPAFTAEFAAPLQSKRDLVIYDQRGTGRSQPVLTCPELPAARDSFAELLTPAQEAARAARSLIACHDRLSAEGNDLTAYSSAATAQDIADLMTALGYDRFNIYGLSNGARVALTALRDLPNQRIRSVVLDSVVPLQSIALGAGPASVQRSLNLLFADCAADAGCNHAYPDLRQTIFDLYDRLNAAPLTLQPTGPDGQPFTVVVTGDRLIVLAGGALQSAGLIPFLPLFSTSTASGNTALLTASLSPLAEPELYSPGVAVAVFCNEELPFDTAEVLEMAAQGVDPSLVRAYSADPYCGDDLRLACAQWGSPPDPVENEPVGSEVPALILAGEYDTATPPPYGHLAAQTLPNSFYFEFRGFGHVELFQQAAPTGPPACAMQVMAQFLDDPTHEPDGSCVTAIPPPHFAGT